ncbi:hypothetical protein GOBAR_DD06097 [Gossypium barbadense]|nr:hypothetical protein GOBAR_DD06097 [Gossypium barbadense]
MTKVRRRTDKPPDPDDLVVNEIGVKVDSVEVRLVSWRINSWGNTSEGIHSQKENDFELGEGGAKKEIIDGIPFITFSDRVYNFIAKCMARTIIVKLLGRQISYLNMVNILQSIWRTNQPLQIIDLENDHFSVKFQNEEESLTVFSGEPLPKGLYTKSLLKFIGSTIGPIAKINRNRDNNSRGQFTRLVVHIYLGKP